MKEAKEQFPFLENPDGTYRIFPIVHDLCDPATDIQKRVDELLEGGAGGFVTNTTWTDKAWVYNPENTQKLAQAADYIHSKGANVWMYDEYYYPSGWANGYAVQDHPEYIARNITLTCISVKAGEAVCIPRAENNAGFLYAAFYRTDWEECGKGTWNETAAEGVAPEDALFLAFWVKDHRGEYTDPVGASRGHLNFLNADAVNSFLEHGLEPVDKAVGLNQFYALFTDEPTLSTAVLCFPRGKVDFSVLPLPYDHAVPEAYRALWGEDLSYIHLFTGLSRRAKLTRVRYYETLSRMARKNYTDRVRIFCHEKGTRSSGHFLLEEGLKYHVGYYGDYMRVVGGQDIPGCDVLCADAQRFWLSGAGFGTACVLAGKYPSSLSRLNGHNTTMLEICPVNFPDKIKKEPFKEFMALSGCVLFAGITHFNAYGYSFIQNQEEHRKWNLYVGRMQAMLRESRSDSRVGIYYPIHQMQALFAAPALKPEVAVDFYPETEQLETDMETLTNKLLWGKCDFNFIDDDHLSTKDGCIACGGVEIHTLIVPFTEYMPARTAQEIARFAKDGGEVIFVNCVPSFGLDGQPLSLSGQAVPLEALTVPGERGIDGDILVSPYRKDGRRFLFCLNPWEEEREVRLDEEKELYFPADNRWLKASVFVLPAERSCMIF